MDIASVLGGEAESLLGHVSKGIPKEDLHLPGPDVHGHVKILAGGQEKSSR